MKTFKAFGYNWKSGEVWGNYHPDYNYQWYSNHCVRTVGDDQLELLTYYLPLETDGIIIPRAIGLVVSEETFGYGTIEADIQFPLAKHMWPGFWLDDPKNWLPEIDIVEGYSDNNPNYKAFRFTPKFPFFSLYNAQTNVHYKNLKEEHDAIKGKTGFICKNPATNFVNYKLVREPESIKIYYNNKLVRKVDEFTKKGELILDHLRNKELQVKFDSFVLREKNTTDYSTKMIIRNFKFHQDTSH